MTPSALEDAALGRAVRELAEAAQGEDEQGWVFVAARVVPDGGSPFWHLTARRNDPDRLVLTAEHAELGEAFREMRAMIPTKEVSGA